MSTARFSDSEPDPRKVVVLSGAGVSAESDLATYRDANGLWRQYRWQDVASLAGWKRHPEAVLEFYNERRRQAWSARPNAAHEAIARLERAYEVVVITQNVDDLHERAGSIQVLHVHGELAWARSEHDPALRYHLGGEPIALGQNGEDGAQLRPDIVWFGESVRHFQEAQHHLHEAGKVLVVGTSLTVHPAAGLVDAARWKADKVLVSLEIDHPPRGYACLRETATAAVPRVVDGWLAAASP